MQLNSISDAFASKIRISIIAALLNGKKDFSELKKITDSTDGNLSTHLTKLEQLGYISVNKKFIGKRPHSDYSLTEKAKLEFHEYVQMLEGIISSNI